MSASAALAPDNDRAKEFDTLFGEGPVDVFLDTSEYIAHHYDFQGRDLGKLKSHGEAGRVRVHSVSVTDQENTRHLKERFEKVSKAFCDPFLKALPVSKRPTRNFAEADFVRAYEDWKSEAKVLVHGVEKVDLVQLMERYHNALPPFSAKDKKNEFPDAIAAAALEDWARDHFSTILVVSRDPDWRSITQYSTSLVMAELKEVLDYLNRLESRQERREQAFEAARASVHSTVVVEAIKLEAAERIGEYDHWLVVDDEMELVENLRFDATLLELYLDEVDDDGSLEVSGTIRGTLQGEADNPDETIGIYDSGARPFFGKRRLRKDVVVDFTARLILDQSEGGKPRFEEIGFGWQDLNFNENDVVARSQWD